MVLRRFGVGWLLVVGLAAVPGRFVRADEPPAEQPEGSRHVETPRDEADPAKTQADKAEAAKQAAKDEEEFYDLYKSLADTVDQVDRNYVKKVDRRELMEAAIKGVLSKLDPYSSYIGRDGAGAISKTPSRISSAASAFRSRWTTNQLKILSPLVGTPGLQGGPLAGDRIIKIGDESTADFRSTTRCTGSRATSARASRSRWSIPASEAETITVKREVIHVDTVLGDRRKSDESWDYMLDPDKRIGYIRVTTFSRDTAADLKKAIDDLEGRKLQRADSRPAIQSRRAADLGDRHLRHVSHRGADREHRGAEHAEAGLGRHQEDRRLQSAFRWRSW